MKIQRLKPVWFSQKICDISSFIWKRAWIAQINLTFACEASENNFVVFIKFCTPPEKKTTSTPKQKPNTWVRQVKRFTEKKNFTTQSVQVEKSVGKKIGVLRKLNEKIRFLKEKNQNVKGKKNYYWNKFVR